MISFRRIKFTEFDLILCVIPNFHNATLYEMTSAIVIQL